MDTITHTLFGIALYRAFNKDLMPTPLKRALFATALVGSQIPDIDVISQFWDTEGQYLSWHRGLTHSIFLTPIWAVLIASVCSWIWKVKDIRLFWLALLAVVIHDTSDLFNAWGTGYLEPFSSVRVTFGTIPIVDLTIWLILFVGLWLARKRAGRQPHRVFKGVWAVIALHVFLQSAQGYIIYQQVEDRYEQVALTAAFVPTQFQVIGKQAASVEISAANVWSEPQLRHTLPTLRDADLDQLFAANPAAKTLYQWAPFVVVTDEGGQLGIYDPRFYRNGQSFLFERMERHTK